jgi:hypothetical protein
MAYMASLLTLIVLLVSRGDRQINRYGPPPL